MTVPDQSNPLSELFSEIEHLPFLFVGSGLARRYKGLPDWQGLLEHFAKILHPGNPVALQIFTGGGENPSWPDVASKIEAAFNKHWLTHDDFSSERETFKDLVKSGTSPFKIQLANYFREAADSTGDKAIDDELSILKNIAKRSVAGVITTNYDRLLEERFENYESFVGQEQLLFGRTHGISEIYKIHGCCSDPNSLVITAEDYAEFDRRNAYLAAKLLTIFVEHPIIFLGYSLNDPNVKAILEAIADCLTPKNLKELKQRLIFVEYSNDPDLQPQVGKFSLVFSDGKGAIEMTKVTLNGFSPLYKELLANKYEYNPRLLRQLKRDIYKMVATNEPIERFKVADIENDDELEKVQFLAGIGVIPDEAHFEPGHRIPEASELFLDVVFENGNLDVKSLVEDALEKLLKGHSFSLPIHRYLWLYEQQHDTAPLSVSNYTKHSLSDFLNKTLLKKRETTPGDAVSEVLSSASTPVAKITELVVARDLEENTTDLGEFLSDFLTNHPECLDGPDAGLKTNVKRLIKIYDWLKYGQEKDALNT